MARRGSVPRIRTIRGGGPRPRRAAADGERRDRRRRDPIRDPRRASPGSIDPTGPGPRPPGGARPSRRRQRSSLRLPEEPWGRLHEYRASPFAPVTRKDSAPCGGVRRRCPGPRPRPGPRGGHHGIAAPAPVPETVALSGEDLARGGTRRRGRPALRSGGVPTPGPGRASRGGSRSHRGSATAAAPIRPYPLRRPARRAGPVPRWGSHGWSHMRPHPLRPRPPVGGAVWPGRIDRGAAPRRHGDGAGTPVGRCLPPEPVAAGTPASRPSGRLRRGAARGPEPEGCGAAMSEAPEGDARRCSPGPCDDRRPVRDLPPGGDGSPAPDGVSPPCGRWRRGDPRLRRTGGPLSATGRCPGSRAAVRSHGPAGACGALPSSGPRPPQCRPARVSNITT